MAALPTARLKARSIKGQSVLLDWLKAHANFDGPDCLTWPFGHDSDGYACMIYDGYAQRAARVMCKLVNGPPPEGKPMAAHNCGHGDKGCVHPGHVQWKSWKENAADRIAHGRSGTGRRGHLTQEIADEIRVLAGHMSQREIALKFGTTRSNVEHIINGKTWNNRLKGASKRGNRYWSRIKLDGKTETLGVFDTAEEAAAAYRARWSEYLAKTTAAR